MITKQIEYTQFGRRLTTICQEKGYSLRRLAQESQLASHALIVRACQGKLQPSRDVVLRWCTVLQCDADERRKLLHPIGYATPEEMEEDV